MAEDKIIEFCQSCGNTITVRNSDEVTYLRRIMADQLIGGVLTWTCSDCQASGEEPSERHEHYCPDCHPPRVWEHSSEPCHAPYEYVCPPCATEQTHERWRRL